MWKPSRVATRESVAPRVPADNPARARYAAAFTARASGRGRERPLAVPLDDLAVERQLAAVPEILDDVPVDRALVGASRDGVRAAESEVNRPMDLLVEERVLHVPRDRGVAPDAELA